MTRRTALSASQSEARKAEKSCSPASAAAAKRMAVRSSARGTCQVKRCQNAERQACVQIRYSYTRAVAWRRASNPSPTTRDLADGDVGRRERVHRLPELARVERVLGPKRRHLPHAHARRHRSVPRPRRARDAGARSRAPPRGRPAACGRRAGAATHGTRCRRTRGACGTVPWVTARRRGDDRTARRFPERSSFL